MERIKDSDLFALLVILVSVLLIITVFVGGVFRIVRPIDKSSCHSFGEQSGREVRFVDYNLMSWDCLTLAQDGKWISAYNLINVTD